MKTKLECWECDPCLPDLEEKKCNSAIMCYSYTRKEVENVHKHFKGCIHSQRDLQFYCKNTRHLRTMNEASRLVIGYDGQCCDSNFCNNHTFPFNAHLSSGTHLSSSQTNKSFPFNLVDSFDMFSVQKNSSSFIFVVWIFLLVSLVILLLTLLWKRCIKPSNWYRRTTHLARRHPVRLDGFVGNYHGNWFGNGLHPSLQAHCPDGFQQHLKVTAAGDSTLREMFDHSITSGSGSGMPFLAQRTMAKEISLMECIGKGRFGEVRRAILFGEEVAVKIFFTKDEQSWNRETEIFNMYTLNHDAILKYLGSGVTSYNTCTQMWLITDYHKLGSLHDFLEKYTLNVTQALGVMTSAICGLFHLHDEFESSDLKPGIAHRDLKSKNILMKSTESVCLADFGLSVTSVQVAQRAHGQGNIRQGTKRYMPPEVLDESIDVTNFESYKCADIYSFSLVLWEILQRCNFMHVRSRDYRLPYHQWVSSDPSFDQMVKVVCTDKRRPELPVVWVNGSNDPNIDPSTIDDDESIMANQSIQSAGPNQTLIKSKQMQRQKLELKEHQHLFYSICNLIRESWTEKPQTRLTALRIKKDLIRLQNRWNTFRGTSSDFNNLP